MLFYSVAILKFSLNLASHNTSDFIHEAILKYLSLLLFEIFTISPSSQANSKNDKILMQKNDAKYCVALVIQSKIGKTQL